MIVAGVLFLVWPIQYRRSIAGIRRRIAARQGDVGRFDRAMDRRWTRVALVVAPFAGVVFIVVGATW